MSISMLTKEDVMPLYNKMKHHFASKEVKYPTKAVWANYNEISHYVSPVKPKVMGCLFLSISRPTLGLPTAKVAPFIPPMHIRPIS
jgi:hypothetical protein